MTERPEKGGAPGKAGAPEKGGAPGKAGAPEKGGAPDKGGAPGKAGAPRKRARLHAAERRAQILAAALEIFGERGYWGTSLQEIGQRCDLTVTGVLYHFGSKEALLRALLESLDQGYVDALGRHMGGEGAIYRLGQAVPGLDVGLTCRLLVKLSAENIQRTRLYSRLENESTEAGHPAHDFFLRREQRILDAYEVAVSGTAENPQAVARMIMALISGLRVQWLRDPEGTDLVAMWDRIAEGIPVLRCGGGAGGA